MRSAITPRLSSGPWLAAALALGMSPVACGGPADDAPAAAAAETMVQPAVDGIFEAFRTHPLVGLGDAHGLAQQEDFYAALIRDPRFAREVGNIVVEFGAGGRQDVIDRYVAGESVPYEELRTVWTDTVGWYPPPGLLGFVQLFAAVRETNQALPEDERIRVWLGEPPIDWSAVEVRGDARPAQRRRDSHPASIIENILARNEKALVIYGSFHFIDRSNFWMRSLRPRVEAKRPGAFFVVLAYDNFHRPAACAPLLEQAAHVWPTPALAAPADGGAPEPDLRECATLDEAEWIERGLISLSGLVKPSKVLGDGVLFIGPTESFTWSPSLPDLYLDADYRREIDRRLQLNGRGLFPLPEGFSLRKADYEIDLHAPGYAELLDAMFAEHDRNGDGVVTADEYVDPLSR